jgi:hypothetical protein
MFSGLGAVVLGIVKSNAFATLVMGIGGWFATRKHNKMTEDRESKYTKATEYLHSIKPYIISGVKYVEKVVPDNTENKAIAKADLALKVIGGMLESNGEKVIPEVIKGAIGGIVDELNANGKLKDLAPAIKQLTDVAVEQVAEKFEDN